MIAHKLPDKYNIDYIICTDFGKQVAFVEYKWYFKDWTTIGDYTAKLSLKVKDLLLWSELTKTKPFFAIRMRDGFYYWMPTREKLTRSTIKMGGRTDRGLAGDIEPMVHIPEPQWDCLKLDRWMSDHIRGGYILLARQMMESDFFKFTPCCREVYLWLLLSVNFVDGKRFKRGANVYFYR